MHRLIVAILTAVDAAIAAAVGVAAVLAPLTVLWVLGFDGGADWSALWPASVAVWQLGNLVPFDVTLPAEYIAATGIDANAASFVVSLAPLAFASFTAIFAARSGIRSSRAEAWGTGVGVGSTVFATLATLAAITAGNGVAQAELWRAVLLPTLVYAVPALVAALVTEWREAGSGWVAVLRDRVEAVPHGWGEVPALVARGTAVVVVGLVVLGALVTTVALFAGGGEIVALFQAGNVDALGATMLTLVHLAYLPTLVVWGMAFAAGPGFAVGEGTAVSPAATQVGVIPGIPVLGAVPDSSTPWLLLLALIPVGLGAFAGWIARSRLVHPVSAVGDASEADAEQIGDAAGEAGRVAELEALLTRDAAETAPIVLARPAGGAHASHVHADGEEPIAARFVVVVAIAVLSAAAAALLAALAAGSLGPGRLAVMGPEPGPVALAIGVEVFIGAAILLLSPRSSRHSAVPSSLPSGAREAPTQPPVD